MRLINADKLLENLEWLNEYDHIIFEAVKTSIDSSQLVEAIPIEWILNHPKFPHKNEDRKKCILDMIEDWEKENDR